MSNIDTGLRDRLESQASSSAARLDNSETEYMVHNATRTGAERSIQIKESAKSSAQATIDNPPMKTITESSKKGSSSRQVVDENAVAAAKADLAQLEVEIANLETERDTAKNDETTAEKTKDTEQVELDETSTQLTTFNDAEELLGKFEDSFSGTDGFANEGEEAAALKRLNEYTEKIEEWGDIDGDGIDDGKHFADAVNGFLYGENGYLSQERTYEADYIAAGEVAPWRQIDDESTETESETAVANDTSHSDLVDRVFG